MDKVIAAARWFKTHKARFAVVLLFAAGGFQALGLTDISGPLFVGAAWLHGAGAARSDAEVKARQ